MSKATPQPRRARTPRPPNPRAPRRNLLFVIGIVPSILALLFAGKVGLMLQANAAGSSSYDDGQYADAMGSFERNLTANLFEEWKAPFNRGDAQHQDKAYDDAIESYETALKSVPTEDECTVRINLALTHELVGDAALDQGKPDRAIDSWQTGRDVLAEGDCPTDAGRGDQQSEVAATVDQRLADKLKQQDAPEPKPDDQQGKRQKPKDDKGDQEETPEEKQKREELERRNQEGTEERRESQELEEGGGSSDPDPTW